MSTTKDSRIALRMTADDEHIIKAAAESQGRSVTDFTVQAARSAAENVLADRTLFVLDAASWDEFNAILDRPVQPNAKLEKLLTSPSVFDA